MRIYKGLYHLKFKDRFSVNYNIDSRFVDFPGKAPQSAEIYLLDLELSSRRLGKIRKPVFYFLFENINFLKEVLLKYGVNVSYIVKVNEGCQKGGNKKSITLAYAFLSVLKTRYLIIDSRWGEFDFDVFEEIKTDLALKKLNDFELIELPLTKQIALSVRDFYPKLDIFKVDIKENPLKDARIVEIMKAINEKLGNENGIFGLT